MNQSMKKYLPTSLYRVLRYLYYSAFDLYDFIRGKRDPLVPPCTMGQINAGDFRLIGNEFLDHFQRLGGLQPGDRVLDVGCGNGRMAVPLTRLLTDTGSYDGFDIMRSNVDWCIRHITKRFPRFHFRHVDIFNKHYNPTGTIQGSEFNFPYPDGAFDFVLLTSVFTHLLPAELERYLYEVTRVLAPGGRCFITYFLLNDISRELIQRQQSSKAFIYHEDGYYTTNPEIPEEATAYAEDDIVKLYTSIGLNIVSPIYYGAWCGRPDYLSYQDVIVAVK